MLAVSPRGFQIVAKVRAHFGLSAPRFQQKK